jgi:hypothetical protein
MMPNGHKMLQIVIKYTNIYNSKALQILPKLGFLVRKQTIWQPCWATIRSFDTFLSVLGKVTYVGRYQERSCNPGLTKSLKRFKWPFATSAVHVCTCTCYPLGARGEVKNGPLGANVIICIFGEF